MMGSETHSVLCVDDESVPPDTNVRKKDYLPCRPIVSYTVLFGLGALIGAGFATVVFEDQGDPIQPATISKSVSPLQLWDWKDVEKNPGKDGSGAALGPAAANASISNTVKGNVSVAGTVVSKNGKQVKKLSNIMVKAEIYNVEPKSGDFDSVDDIQAVDAQTGEAVGKWNMDGLKNNPIGKKIGDAAQSVVKSPVGKAAVHYSSRAAKTTQGASVNIQDTAHDLNRAAEKSAAGKAAIKYGNALADRVEANPITANAAHGFYGAAKTTQQSAQKLVSGKMPVPSKWGKAAEKFG